MLVSGIMTVDWKEFVDYHLHNRTKDYVLAQFKNGELYLEFYNDMGYPTPFLDVLNKLEQQGKVTCKATPFVKNPKPGEPNQVIVYKLVA